MKLRTDLEIRQAATPKGLAAKVKAFFAEAEEMHRQRGLLSTPSKRQSVVLWFYGVRSLDEIPDHEKALAEAVCIEHDANRVVYFGESRIGGRIESLPASALLLEFAKLHAAELEKEIEAVREALLPAFESTGCAHEIEGAAPIQTLQRTLARAREAIERGGGGADAMQSTFRHIA